MGMKINKKQPVEQDVHSLALERMHALYERFDKVVVSFSGGKDSTACMNIALEVARELGRLPLDVYTFDEEAIPPETVEYMERVRLSPDINFYWYCMPIEHRNACSRTEPYWYCWDAEKKDKWVRPEMPANVITEIDGFRKGYAIPECTPLIWGPEHGNIANVMGIRTQESMVRYRAVARKKGWDCFTSEFAGAKHIKKAYPVYDWSTEDVWRAPHLFGWDYNKCTPAETPIWMGDFSFKPIQNVTEGDTVLGWGENENGRSVLVRSKVLKPQFIGVRPLVKITMASGRTIRCTEDHVWQIKKPGKNGNYYYGIPEVGSQLAYVAEVQGASGVREAAWLGGVYDGEGCGDRLYQNPNHNPAVYAEIERALSSLSIPYKRLNGNSDAQNGFRISGGRAGLLQFMNECDPIRRVSRQTDDIILGGRFRRPDTVVSIEPDGTEPVFALTTTTGNYVAWGYASKNSYDLMQAVGLPIHQARCAPPYGEQPIRGLWTFKVCWPEMWAKMVDRVAGAATAARYANTELYGFGVKDSDLPEGKTWEEFTEETYKTLDSKGRAEVGKPIHNIIAGHKRKTKDAIPDDEPHHVTGLCWKYLYSIAAAGGNKFGRQEQKVQQKMQDAKLKSGAFKK